MDDAAFRICAVVPTYDNPRTVTAVVESIRQHVPDVVVIDDGSAEDGRAVVEALGTAGKAHVRHRPENGGKGAAVKDGFAAARELGFTHVVQIDADGQHDIDDLPLFVRAGREHPAALVLGTPVYDDQAPRSRVIGRGITRFWIDLEVGPEVIADAMCGFRVYPLDAVERVTAASNHMDFDIEIAVRLAWSGVQIVNIPTRVRYFGGDEGGVSHFDVLRDNLRISWLHTRLFNVRVWGALTGWLRRS